MRLEPRAERAFVLRGGYDKADTLGGLGGDGQWCGFAFLREDFPVARVEAYTGGHCQENAGTGDVTLKLENGYGLVLEFGKGAALHGHIFQSCGHPVAFEAFGEQPIADFSSRGTDGLELADVPGGANDFLHAFAAREAAVSIAAQCKKDDDDQDQSSDPDGDEGGARCGWRGFFWGVLAQGWCRDSKRVSA